MGFERIQKPQPSSNIDARDLFIKPSLQLKNSTSGIQKKSLDAKQSETTRNGQYIVESGDTPSSIAKIFGITVWDLAKYNQGVQESGGFFNPIGDGDYNRYWKKDGVNWSIKPGDKLEIPRSASFVEEEVLKKNNEKELDKVNQELAEGKNEDLSIKITNQVLNLISADAAITLQDDMAKAIWQADKKGLVIKDAKMGTWKSTWATGNQHVSKETVAATKASFKGGVTSLKIVKGLGIVASFAGGGISIYQYINGEISGAKLATDLVFTGIAFIPVVGWIISGVYFFGDAVGWDNISNSMERTTKGNQEILGQSWRLMGSGANK